jgi:hypothetical protein
VTSRSKLVPAAAKCGSSLVSKPSPKNPGGIGRCDAPTVISTGVGPTAGAAGAAIRGQQAAAGHADLGQSCVHAETICRRQDLSISSNPRGRFERDADGCSVTRWPDRDHEPAPPLADYRLGDTDT